RAADPNLVRHVSPAIVECPAGRRTSYQATESHPHLRMTPFYSQQFQIASNESAEPSRESISSIMWNGFPFRAGVFRLPSPSMVPASERERPANAFVIVHMAIDWLGPACDQKNASPAFCGP